MTAPHDLDRQLQAYLVDGPVDLPDPSFDAVRDRIDSTRQRVVVGPWRFPTMNKFITIGAGVAAVAVALAVGVQLLPPASPGVGVAPTAAPTPPSAEPTPTSTAAPSVAAPSSAADGSLPLGPFQVSDDARTVTLDIESSGWFALEDFLAVSKGDDSQDPPETVGAALLAWSWPAGTLFHVYDDPCRWRSTVPEVPAMTPGEIAAALATQAETDATEPVDVTVGGYAGKMVTLRVPLSYEVPGASREEEFGACDEDQLVFYGIEADAGTTPLRNVQGPGQVDELSILDVDGAIVILDVTYSPATPAELVEEVRRLAQSATFE